MINVYPLAVLLFIGSSLTLLLAVLLWKKRNVPGSLACAMFMIAVTLYSIGYAFEIMSSDLEIIKLWLRVEYLGISFIPALWLIIAIQYTGNDNNLDRRLLAGLLFLSMVTLAGHYTNELHHLFYRNISLEGGLANLEKGPLYWIHIAYFAVSYMVSVFIYLRAYHQSMQTIKRQILLMLLAALPTLIFTLIYLSGFSNNVDIIPFSSLIAGVFFFLGIYRFQLFVINPIVLEKVVYSMSDGVIILNANDGIMTYNQAAVNILPELGRPENGNEGIGKVLKEYPQILKMLQTGTNSLSGEMEINISGEQRYFEASFTLIMNNETTIGKLIILKDITEKQELLVRLNELATRDSLTGLYNRHFFNEAYEKELLRSKRYLSPLSLILLDIDYFKTINDTYGHQIGDMVLESVAGVLTACLRANDVLARYGGEEFIILLPETMQYAAAAVAERIRAELSGSALEVEGKQIIVTASFGVCGIDVFDTDRASGLLTMADDALYKAKSRGRNQVELAG